MVETWIPENRTLMRMIVTGPEDPKVVTDGKDGILLAFDSRPPKGPSKSSSCRRNTQGRLESLPQMYVASSIDVSKPLVPIKGYRLKSGSSDLAEKNWIPFIYDSSLHFVYTPLPHYILEAALDCWVGDCSILFDWIRFDNFGSQYTTKFHKVIRFSHMATTGGR